MSFRPATVHLLQVAREHRRELRSDRRDVLADSIWIHRTDGYRLRARLFPAKHLRNAILTLEWTMKKRHR